MFYLRSKLFAQLCESRSDPSSFNTVSLYFSDGMYKFSKPLFPVKGTPLDLVETKPETLKSNRMFHFFLQSFLPQMIFCYKIVHTYDALRYFESKVADTFITMKNIFTLHVVKNHAALLFTFDF